VEISSWDAAGIVAKVLVYALSLMSAGGAIFIAIFFRFLANAERHRIAWATCSLAALAAIATALRIPIIAGALGGDIASMWDSSLLQFVLQSSEGLSAGLRILGLALLIAVVVLSQGARAVGLAGSLLVAASYATTGHSVSVELGLLPPLLVAIHIIGVSYWIGAFHPLIRLTYGDDLPRIATIMKRFGKIAVVFVGGLIATGSLLLVVLLETPAALATTDYGRMLAVKLVVVAALLGLAALNKFALTPALLRGDKTAPVRLRTSITAELALAIIVLTVTAFFTALSGPPALE
jgi:putative copper resistance protein D